MNTKILEDIGLSKNEIKVYFALLELHQSSATPIVKKSGIPNSKIYPTLEKLIGRGLVSFVIKNNVKYFHAADPQNLIEFLSKKQQSIEEQKDEIEQIIPQLELKRQLAAQTQEAHVYEGFKGMKVAFNTILSTMKKGESYYVFSLGGVLVEEKLIRFFQNYHAKRVEKGIKVRILSRKKFKNVMAKWHGNPGMAIKYISQKFPVGAFIFKGHVLTVVWGENPSAFIIKSAQNYESYKAFFDEMWKKAR
ncbi:hypothetical protein CL620_03110 [archaeon]|nr:hypothetical protein [archaeon]|tara:strand:+ start:257 stop:1003 length:747 start_codon:yes stop_codon:yes gene_type:complete